MEHKEYNLVKITGKGILTATDPKTGKIVARVESPNIICNEGLYLIAAFSRDEHANFDTGITYCEIGTGTTAPAAGDETLTTYHGRLAVTSNSRNNYVVTFSTFFTAAQATANIKEAGMWGSALATASQATGFLFSHFLVAFDNSAGAYDCTISYVLTIARG